MRSKEHLKEELLKKEIEELTILLDAKKLELKELRNSYKTYSVTTHSVSSKSSTRNCKTLTNARTIYKKLVGNMLSMQTPMTSLFLEKKSSNGPLLLDMTFSVYQYLSIEEDRQFLMDHLSSYTNSIEIYNKFNTLMSSHTNDLWHNGRLNKGVYVSDIHQYRNDYLNLTSIELSNIIY